MLKKYTSVYDTLMTEISRGEISVGTFLPGENQLAERFETSRETIRRALTLMQESGVIQKIRGKGSLVLARSDFVLPVSGLTSYKEVSERLSIRVDTRVQRIEGRPLPVRDFRALNPDITAQTMLYVERLRVIDGLAVIIDKDYISPDVVLTIPEVKAANSLFEYFEHDLGLSIGVAQKLITIEAATQTDRRLLDLDGQTDIVVVRSKTSLTDGRTISYTESRHRADKFRFESFVRRIHAE
ncbi:trehalose operon repressor [Furfurilactobacillus entadae]|uniref:trehalose operon repressor n=1 Tax=Furfurilactobacillus entadae TaxID=2922307 RepID=UPI0035E56939